MLMRYSLKLKNGEEWLLMYSFLKDDLLEITPFQYTDGEKKIYLQDGEYELINGLMVIKDKKINYIKHV